MAEREYDPTLQSPSERRSLLSQGMLRLRRLFVQVANITTLRTDTITERTSAAGVTVDTAQIKDNGIVFIEAADHPITPVATKGQVWVKTATPNELYFTDDAGTDVQLGTGGGTPTLIEDADQNTKVQTEESADENTIRMDVAGTERFVLKDASTHFTLTGETKMLIGADIVSVVPGSQVLMLMAMGGTKSSGATWLQTTGTMTFDTNNQTGIGVKGAPTISPSSGVTGSKMFGLQYDPAVGGGGGGATVSEFAAISAQPFTQALTGTVTTTWGLRLKQLFFGVNSDHTTTYGIEIENYGETAATDVHGIMVRAQTSGTNRYGLKMEDISGGTKARLLELGGADTAALLQLQGTGEWTAAANETPMFLKEGATPTQRQIKSTDMAYLSVTSDDTATSSSSLYDVWDEDNYPSATLNTTDNVTAKNITYTSTNGRFTLDVAGIYEITFIISPTTTSTQPFTIELQDGGVAFYSHACAFAHSTVDPTLQSITVIRSFSAADYINVLVNGTNLVANVGTTMSISKIADVTEDKVAIFKN